MKGPQLNLMCACVITIAILIAYHLGRQRVVESFGAQMGAEGKQATDDTIACLATWGRDYEQVEPCVMERRAARERAARAKES